MRQYLDLVQQVLREGERRTDRTGVGTLSIFGAQMRFDLREGFPLVTTKKVNFDAVVWELLWMLSGSTNIHDLHKACRACQQQLPIGDFVITRQVRPDAVCPKCSGTKIDPGSRIWDNWAREGGNLGPVYGASWRSWPIGPHGPGQHVMLNGKGLDQISEALRTIKTKPDSRRIIVNAWNVAEIEQMALPPCHAFFQFYVGFDPDMQIRPTDEWTYSNRQLQPGDTVVVQSTAYAVQSFETVLQYQQFQLVSDSGEQLMHSCPTGSPHWSAPGRTKPTYLDCQLYQRSGDVAIGVPFNIASYALLTQMFAHECGLTPRHFIHTFGDAHIYLNHVETTKRQLDRSPRRLPKVKLDEGLTVLGATEEQIHLEGYNPHPFLKFEIAV